MALKGSFTGSIRNGYSIRVDWSATQDIEKNNSTITAKMYLINKYSLRISSRTNALTIDGTTYNLSSNVINTIGEHYIGACTKTVAHNSDGTKSVDINAVFNIKATLSGVYYDKITASATIKLDTIPRATTPVIQSSVEIGSLVTINLPRAFEKFKHNVKFVFGNVSGTIGTSLDTSVEWNVPMDLLNEIPNNISAVCSIICETYNGDVKIGDKKVLLALTVGENIIPTVNFTIDEVGSDVAKQLGKYIQNVSKLYIKANGTGVYGSTIKNYKIEIGSSIYNSDSATSNILEIAGDLTIKASVTDSRDRTTTITKTINVVAYEKPFIESFKVERTSEDNVDISIKAGVTDLEGNTPAYLIEYKKANDTEYTENHVVSDTTPMIDKTLSLGGIDVDFGYNFKLTVSDLFNSLYITCNIGTEFTLIDYNASGKGLALGKVSEEKEMLEINIPIKFCGTTLTDLIYPIGSIYMSVNEVNPNVLFGGTWEQIKDVFLLSAGDKYKVGTSGGESEHKLTVDEMPSHTHIQDEHTHSIKYKGFTGLTPSQSGSFYNVLRRNDVQDSYDGIDEDGAIPTKAVNQNAGGNISHNNMPPYFTVYVWKRIK